MIATDEQWFKSLAQASKYCGVSEKSMSTWKLRFDNFPQKRVGPDGKKAYSSRDFDAFMKVNQVGLHRGDDQNARLNKAPEDSPLHKLKTAHLTERVETARLTKETQAIELAKTKGMLVEAEEVESFHRKLAATIMTTLKAMPDQIEREIPERLPDQEAWEVTRIRIVEIVERNVKDAARVAQDFVKG